MQKKIFKTIGFIIMALAFMALLTWAVMLLWNSVLADVAPVSKITFTQSFGLLLLAKLLFGGWGGKHKTGKQQWKRKMAEKFSGMTAEEREQMKQEWRNCCSRRKQEQQQEASPPPTTI